MVSLLRGENSQILAYFSIFQAVVPFCGGSSQRCRDNVERGFTTTNLPPIQLVPKSSLYWRSRAHNLSSETLFSFVCPSRFEVTNTHFSYSQRRMKSETYQTLHDNRGPHNPCTSKTRNVFASDAMNRIQRNRTFTLHFALMGR